MVFTFRNTEYLGETNNVFRIRHIRPSKISMAYKESFNIAL